MTRQHEKNYPIGGGLLSVAIKSNDVYTTEHQMRAAYVLDGTDRMCVRLV